MRTSNGFLCKPLIDARLDSMPDQGEPSCGNANQFILRPHWDGERQDASCHLLLHLYCVIPAVRNRVYAICQTIKDKWLKCADHAPLNVLWEVVEIINYQRHTGLSEPLQRSDTGGDLSRLRCGR